MPLPSWFQPQTFPENFGSQASPYSGFFNYNNQQWAMPTNPEMNYDIFGNYKGYYTGSDMPAPNGAGAGQWAANFVDENGQPKMVGSPSWELADNSIDPALISALLLSAGVATGGFGLMGGAGGATPMGGTAADWFAGSTLPASIGAGAGAMGGFGAAAPIEVDGLLGMGPGAGDLAGLTGTGGMVNGAFLGENVPSGIPAWDSAFTNVGGQFDPSWLAPTGANIGGAIPTSPQSGNGSTPTPVSTPTPGMPNVTGPASSLLNNLFGGNGGGMDLASLIAALYGANQNQSNAADLRSYIDQSTNRMLPIYNEMQANLLDPTKYFNSPEFKALDTIDTNKLVRTDAAQGGLSNDMARQVALQNYRYQHLNDYRNSLQSAYKNTQDPVTNLSNMYMLAAMLKNGQWNPLFNAAGNSGGGINLGNIGSWISNLFGGNQNLVTDPGSGNVWDFGSNDWYQPNSVVGPS